MSATTSSQPRHLYGTAANGLPRILGWVPCDVCDGSGFLPEQRRYCACHNGEMGRVDGEWALMSPICRRCGDEGYYEDRAPGQTGLETVYCACRAGEALRDRHECEGYDAQQRNAL
jgi:hypothetical protein